MSTGYESPCCVYSLFFCYLLLRFEYASRHFPLEREFKIHARSIYTRIDLKIRLNGYHPPKCHLKSFLHAAQSYQSSKHNQLSPDEHKSLEN